MSPKAVNLLSFIALLNSEFRRANFLWGFEKQTALECLMFPVKQMLLERLTSLLKPLPLSMSIGIDIITSAGMSFTGKSNRIG